MISGQVSCCVNQETVMVASNLLMKEKVEGFEAEICFPEYISRTDLEIYLSFQNTGYIKTYSHELVAKIILVADFLKQFLTSCKLIEFVLSPQVNNKNFEQILKTMKLASELSLSKFVQSCVGIIMESPEKYLELLRFLPLSSVRKMIDCLDGSLKEIMIQVFIEKSADRSFIEIFEIELESSQSAEFVPGSEFEFKFSLNDLDKEIEEFEFNELKINLAIEKISDQVKIKLSAEPKAATGQVLKGKVTFQGELTDFFYITGSTSTILTTTQKTNTASLKLSLNTDPFLSALIKLSSTEALEGGSLSQSSLLSISLLCSYLKPLTSPNKIFEIIADWSQSHPNKSLDLIFESSDWTHESPEFWSQVSKKFPILPLSQIPSLSLHPNQFKSSNENFFILDISEISSPSSSSKARNHSKPQRPQSIRSLQMNASEFNSSLRYNEIQNKFCSPVKGSKAHHAIEEIKKLKRKLINQRSHNRASSFCSFLSFNLD